MKFETRRTDEGRWVVELPLMGLSGEGDTEEEARRQLIDKLKSQSSLPAAILRAGAQSESVTAPAAGAAPPESSSSAHPGPIPKLRSIFDEEDSDKPKPRIPFSKLVRVTWSAIKLVWETARYEAVLVMGLQVVSGLVLPAELLLGKEALDALLTDGRLSSALPAIFGVFLLMTLNRFISAFNQEWQRILTEKVSRNSELKLLEKALTLDLEAFETPSFYDQLSRGQQEARIRPFLMVMFLAPMVSAAVTVAAFVVYLLAIEPVLLVAVALAYIPLWYVNALASRDRFVFRMMNTPKDRQMHYLSETMTKLDTAKEVRAFGLGTYLLTRYRELASERLRKLIRLQKRNLRRSLLGSLGSTLLTAVALGTLLVFYSFGEIPLTRAAAALGALFLMGQRLSGLMLSANSLYESALFIEDFWTFLDLKPRQITSASDEPAPKEFSRVVVDNVTFTYPEAPKPALRNVSIEIPKGRTVALVGENGSGKTTLAKLLCRLYDPQDGVIRWDDRDIRSCDPDELRRQIAVIFQDFSQYKMSAKENIGFGDVDRLSDSDGITEASRQAGAHDFIDALPDGYDTLLGKLFDRGQELSIGQWQRVALARAFFRQAPVVIMDEPTASLDPRSEYELFKTMRDLFRDRSVLLISHRFSSVRMADLIFVLKDGEVVESGTHEELMVNKGLYAELFRMQASAYLGETE